MGAFSRAFFPAVLRPRFSSRSARTNGKRRPAVRRLGSPTAGDKWRPSLNTSFFRDARFSSFPALAAGERARPSCRRGRWVALQSVLFKMAAARPGPVLRPGARRVPCAAGLKEPCAAEAVGRVADSVSPGRLALTVTLGLHSPGRGCRRRVSVMGQALPAIPWLRVLLPLLVLCQTKAPVVGEGKLLLWVTSACAPNI